MSETIREFEHRVAAGLGVIASEAAIPDLDGAEVVTMSKRSRWRHRAVRLGVAAAVVAIGGLAISQAGGDRADTPAASSKTEIELVPGLTIATTGRQARVGPALVVEASVGPDPQFDPSHLGNEFPLHPIPPGEFVIPTDERGTGDGAALGSDLLVSLGEIDGAQIGLDRYKDQVCIYLGNFTTVTGGGECGAPGLLSFTISQLHDQVDPPTGPWRAAVGLPINTSVVVAEFSDGTIQWQRPIGRTAFFLQSRETPIQNLTVLGAAGDELPS